MEREAEKFNIPAKRSRDGKIHSKITITNLEFKQGREDDDEKHVHPLQLDVINRVVIMRSNPCEIVFTPFMGVGSEVYGAVMNNRKGIGVELKESYYNQAIKNLKNVIKIQDKQCELFAD
jgi:DNA modification methylase